MNATIDGGLFRQMIYSAAAVIETHKEQINELNVFPVPDGDTGTNMSMTLNAALGDLQQQDDLQLGKVAGSVASATLRGARGNSGVILSLLFRGIGKALKGTQDCDGMLLAQALTQGVESAYKAVMKPAEGTILTVSRLAAQAALECAETAETPEEVMQAAISAGTTALAQTVNQNPVLKKAGVIDAGGKGWILILEGMLAAMRGEPVAAPEPGTAAQVRTSADFSDFATEDITFSYCTEFIVSRENEKDPDDLRRFLDNLGDSLVLVDDDEIIKVHVHTNNPGIALQEALTYGSLVKVKIENMRLQHTEIMEKQELAAGSAKAAIPEKDYGLVAVSAGEGLAAVFRDLGVDCIVSGGQTSNPSTQDILSGINDAPSQTVFVLPNNKNIILAAEQAAQMTEKKVVVIASKTIPQGITALLSFDPEQSLEANTSAMTQALATVATMQITYAARDSDFDGYEIHAGDYLALYEKNLFGTNRDLNALLQGLAHKLNEDGREFINVYYGEDTPEQTANEAAQIFAELCPDAEVTLINGGQPVYYFIISAE